MRTTRTILASALILPFLLLACNRDEHAPSAAAPHPEKQAMAPSAQDKMLESTPPAAGMPPTQPSTPKVADSDSHPQKPGNAQAGEPRQGSN